MSEVGLPQLCRVGMSLKAPHFTMPTRPIPCEAEVSGSSQECVSLCSTPTPFQYPITLEYPPSPLEDLEPKPTWERFRDGETVDELDVQ